MKSEKSLVINPNVIPKTFDGQIFVTFNFVNI